MGSRRMFSRQITDDDRFISLSSSAQALFLHVVMASDDEGFCNQVSLAMFKAHASTQDLESLIDSKYLISFDSGVVVVKHWGMSNKIRKDRFHATAFVNEKKLLFIDENGSYSLNCQPKRSDNQVSTNCQPDDNQVSTNCQPKSSQVKSSQFKLSKDKSSSSILDRLSEKEWERLQTLVDDPLELIDRINERTDLDCLIHPYNYCLSVAEERGMMKTKFIRSK